MIDNMKQEPINNSNNNNCSNINNSSTQSLDNNNRNNFRNLQPKQNNPIIQAYQNNNQKTYNNGSDQNKMTQNPIKELTTIVNTKDKNNNQYVNNYVNKINNNLKQPKHYNEQQTSDNNLIQNAIKML